MGTTANFDVPASTVNFAAGDIVPVLSTTTGRGAYLTGTQLRSGMIDQSSPVVVTAGATLLTISAAAHAGRTVVMNNTGPIAITLPTATGTGNRYRFYIGVAATTTSSTIKVGNATDVMTGLIMARCTSDAALIFVATATDDSIGMQGGTKGGFAGDVIEITDVKSGIFSVTGYVNTSGAGATPFLAGV